MFVGDLSEEEVDKMIENGTLHEAIGPKVKEAADELSDDYETESDTISPVTGMPLLVRKSTPGRAPRKRLARAFF